jgi:hypothetical protein
MNEKEKLIEYLKSGSVGMIDLKSANLKKVHHENTS